MKLKPQVVKDLTQSIKPSGNPEALQCLWRGECLDILDRMCTDDARILRNVRLKVVSKPAMADARKYYNKEKLSVDEVGKWPDILYKGSVLGLSGDKINSVFKDHREQYHDSLLVGEYAVEVMKLTQLWIKWRDELTRRAGIAGLAIIGHTLAVWASRKDEILYEMQRAGILPMHYQNTKHA